MNRLRVCLLVFGVLLLCAPVFAQVVSGSGAPYAFVSSGTSTSTVYTDTISTETVTPFVSPCVEEDPVCDPEGMVFGPDNYLYVCNPNQGAIFQVNTSTAASTQIFQSGNGGPSEPQCGHFTINGDLIVSDEAGSGIWIFQNSAITTITSPLSFLAPTLVVGGGSLPCSEDAAFGGAGLTQLKNGDLAFVDSANGCLYIAAYNQTTFPYFTASPVARQITPPAGVTLTNPIGIARDSVSDIFISYTSGDGQFSIAQLDSNYIANKSDFANHTEFTSNTTLYSPEGVFVPCAQTSYPYEYMQFSADDTLYVANLTGIVYSIKVTRSIPGNPVTPSSCGAPAQVGAVTYACDDEQCPGQAVGIALPPTTSAADTTPTVVESTCTFDFGFSAFQVILPSGDYCIPYWQVSETQTLVSNLSSYGNITPTPVPPVSPTAFYGEGGFITVFNVCYVPAGEVCVTTPLPNNATVDYFIGSFSTITNPRLVQCENNESCVILPSIGAFPTATVIPGDGGGGGSAHGGSNIYQVEVPLSTAASGPSEKGYVCGPFFLRNLIVPDPSIVVDNDDLLTIFFRLTNIPAIPPFCVLPAQGYKGLPVMGIEGAQVQATVAQATPSFDLIILPNPAAPGTPPPFINIPNIPASNPASGWYTYVLKVSNLGPAPVAPETFDFSALFNTNNTGVASFVITEVPGK